MRVVLDIRKPTLAIAILATNRGRNGRDAAHGVALTQTSVCSPDLTWPQHYRCHQLLVCSSSHLPMPQQVYFMHTHGSRIHRPHSQSPAHRRLFRRCCSTEEKSFGVGTLISVFMFSSKKMFLPQNPPSWLSGWEEAEDINILPSPWEITARQLPVYMHRRS